MTEHTETSGTGGAGRIDVTPPTAGVCGEGASAHVNCEEALRDLYGYLDGEITAERREHIRVHIEECGPCLDAFDFETDLRELVARTCQTEAPDSLRDRVARAILDCEDESGGASDR